MKITVLTLFPEMFDSFLSVSIVHRTIERGLLQVDFVQIRDFAHDRYRHVDDAPFGGGAGMIMKCQPVLDALDSVQDDNACRILMSPAGHPYTQSKAHMLSQKDHLVILCGHYEGLDERISHHVDEEISIGDYVLTGGETAAMIIIDSVSRLLKGSISDDSPKEESHENGLLEYPQYTRPADYNGDQVPAVLLSGDHAKIREWRVAMALKRTKQYRPDLYASHVFTDEEKKVLRKLEMGKIPDITWEEENDDE
jgi:tRNA (guanine37-N1)-methyltransferase